MILVKYWALSVSNQWFILFFFLTFPVDVPCTFERERNACGWQSYPGSTIQGITLSGRKWFISVGDYNRYVGHDHTFSSLKGESQSLAKVELGSIIDTALSGLGPRVRWPRAYFREQRLVIGPKEVGPIFFLGGGGGRGVTWGFWFCVYSYFN